MTSFILLLTYLLTYLLIYLKLPFPLMTSFNGKYWPSFTAYCFIQLFGLALESVHVLFHEYFKRHRLAFVRVSICFYFGISKNKNLLEKRLLNQN